MTDKYLGESDWRNFAKRQKLSDETLVKAMAKALAALQLAKGPEQQLKALDGIEKQADALRKSAKGNKELASHLDGLDKALGKQRKLSEVEAKTGVQPEDEDEPASALLDAGKLLRQLTLCKRDPERRVQFGFVDAADKNTLPVLALSPKLAGQKLFAKLRDETGVKTGAHGIAWIRNDTELVLQVDKAVSGLVKKVRAPVRECGFRITKVLLYSPDGAVLEQDEAEDQTSPEADAGVGAAFNARLAALLPKLKSAPQDIRSKASEAGLAARQGEFTLAHRLLDETEHLLAATSPDSGQDDASNASVRDAMAQWKARRSAAVASLKSVATQIAAARHARSAAAIMEIQEVMKNLIPEPSTLQQVQELQNYLGADEVVYDVSELADDIRTPLLGALDQLHESLAR
ncbi:hypothetical protein OOT46_17765 [Aquabacterium sp. A7-Y]|uniref:hypothetical protein n=1 Tax=Aquabacterium sp. A7-Y TaxID=1349605 RepID=UPI00223E3948|nr:hypothetical protein [Aquabacterium sp. A7-Y]MCW7539688.1 hypothetical protein [Aquabacterium sp. A7-Y]